MPLRVQTDYVYIAEGNGQQKKRDLQDPFRLGFVKRIFAPPPQQWRLDGTGEVVPPLTHLNIAPRRAGW